MKQNWNSIILLKICFQFFLNDAKQIPVTPKWQQNVLHLTLLSCQGTHVSTTQYVSLSILSKRACAAESSCSLWGTIQNLPVFVTSPVIPPTSLSHLSFHFICRWQHAERDTIKHPLCQLWMQDDLLSHCFSQFCYWPCSCGEVSCVKIEHFINTVSRSTFNSSFFCVLWILDRVGALKTQVFFIPPAEAKSYFRQNGQKSNGTWSSKLPPIKNSQ